MALYFDAANRRIVLSSASVTAIELWSRWADWVAADDNAKYLPAFRSVGGDDLGGGLSIPPYFFLMNGWRVRPMEANQTLTITGNLFVDGAGDPVVPTLGAFNVLTKLVVPTLAIGIATGGGSTAPTAAQNAGAVWEHVVEGSMPAEQMLRVLMAALSGKTTGIGGSTERYLSSDGAKPRITAQFDVAGNRTSVAVDGS